MAATMDREYQDPNRPYELKDSGRARAYEAPGAEVRERSLVGLFSDLWRETATLVRDEAELAKAEISEKVSKAQSAMVEVAAGALILYAGFLVLLFAAAAGLAELLPGDMANWLAPLIVGLIVAITGGILLMAGRNKAKENSLAPERTMRSLRQDADMVKDHADTAKGAYR